MSVCGDLLPEREEGRCHTRVSFAVCAPETKQDTACASLYTQHQHADGQGTFLYGMAFGFFVCLAESKRQLRFIPHHFIKQQEQ